MYDASTLLDESSRRRASAGPNQEWTVNGVEIRLELSPAADGGAEAADAACCCPGCCGGGCDCC